MPPAKLHKKNPALNYKGCLSAICRDDALLYLPTYEKVSNQLRNNHPPSSANLFLYLLRLYCTFLNTLWRLIINRSEFRPIFVTRSFFSHKHESSYVFRAWYNDGGMCSLKLYLRGKFGVWDMYDLEFVILRLTTFLMQIMHVDYMGVRVFGTPGF